MKRKFTHFILAMGAAAMAIPAVGQTPAQEDTWTTIGKGNLREVFFHALFVSSYYPELEVEIQESDQTPGRYRVVNPYENYPDLVGGAYCLDGDHYIVINASDPECVYVELSHTGYVLGPGQELLAFSMAGDMLAYRGGTKESVKREGKFGKLVNGAITFPDNTLLGSLYDFEGEYTPEEDDPSGYLYQYCNTNNMFRLKLPGAPSLDVAATLTGIDDAHTTLTYHVNLDTDVQKAKVALVPGEATQTEVDKVASGAIESQEITASADVAIPYTADGQFTLVVVPYYNDIAFDPILLTHELAYDESEWRKVGTALMHEAFISDLERTLGSVGISKPAVDYEVEVEESVANPGYIRVVDMYGENYPYSSSANYDSSRRWYIYINAQNPDHVYLEYAEGIGLNLGYGRTDLWSYYGRSLDPNDKIYYGLTEEECEKRGYFGKFANNEITLPSHSVCIHFPQVNPTGWYECNTKGTFSLKFKEGQIRGEQSGVESVLVDGNDAPAEYYRLDGVRVGADRLVPGVYIVRKGGEAKKIVIK